VPGLVHVNVGGYHVRDIEFVAAFDVNASKVGRDLGEAIYAAPNNTFRFCDAPRIGVTVQRGPTMDSIGRYVADVVPESADEPVDVAAALEAAEVDVLVSYLPVGSEDATRWYAKQAIEAGCAFVNAIPVFIGREPEWQARFAEAGLPSSVMTSRARSGPPSAIAC
jgi:myo-inositol-1-phosphate synthase